MSPALHGRTKGAGCDLTFPSSRTTGTGPSGPDRAVQGLDETIMNPRHTQEQIGLFPVANTPGTAAMDALLAEAYQARDASIAATLRRGIAAVGRVLAVIGNALVSWPQRRAAYEHLKGLSDRELADIGLSRGDISRVFEPEFTVPGRPANANLPSRKPQVA